MNQTLVDNATLDFLIESTKHRINSRLALLQTMKDQSMFKYEVESIKQDIKHLSKIDAKFVRQCEISIGVIEIISNNEL